MTKILKRMLLAIICTGAASLTTLILSIVSTENLYAGNLAVLQIAVAGVQVLLFLAMLYFLYGLRSIQIRLKALQAERARVTELMDTVLNIVDYQSKKESVRE